MNNETEMEDSIVCLGSVWLYEFSAKLNESKQGNQPGAPMGK